MSEMVEWLRRTIEGDKAAAEEWLPLWPERAHGALATAALAKPGIAWQPFYGSEARHILRNADPVSTIARCEAELAILDDLLTERHYVGDDLYYSCAVATRERDGGEIPNPSRRGDVCDCGRDERVERRIRILASGYQHRDGWKTEWAPA